MLLQHRRSGEEGRADGRLGSDPRRGGPGRGGADGRGDTGRGDAGRDAPAAPGNTGVSEDGAVHKARVAQTISDKLAESTGKRPDKVTCPEHLPARVGATIRCDLNAGSDTLGVTVTAISVNGNQVNYTFKVDNSVE